MNSTSTYIDQTGIEFQLSVAGGRGTTADSVVIKKTPEMVARYEQLAGEFRQARLLELGLWEGGSTALFASLFEPTVQLGVDLAYRPLVELDRYLALRYDNPPIHTYGGIDQTDRSALQPLLDQYIDGPLDIVIDDASHLLQPTTASFEFLFPQLRPGGLYIIEDWSAEHAVERTLNDALVEGRLSQEQQRALAEGEMPREPLSRLILKLTLAAASHPEVIAQVSVRRSLAEIRRGPAELDAESFRLDTLVGGLGHSLLR